MSVRRNVRLRKEYLYRKSLEGKEREIYEKKRAIKEALREGKPLPTELIGEESKYRKDLDLDDDKHEKPLSHIDDEYATAGVRDPKVCVTTSRDASSRLKQFAKEMRLIFPNAQRVNRGNYKVNELVDACRGADFTDMVFLQETRGEPDGLVVCHLPLGPTAYFSVSNCVLRHDIEGRGTISEAYPHLILNEFNSQVGARVGNILKHLFPVPRPDAKRVITFANQDDHISFRHHTFEKKGKEVTLQEVGPRFELKLYQVKQGTIDQLEAETEWVLRPYMNAAKKRKVLG
ncbi:unnamed protein product [Heterosigma akashiwo]|mmetsp:Transcript_25138/g.37760  ORF Transcript_25138/g.37760 Transcript_25138/m.37760 type:complete len:289 (-) Transcript_25138:370-1236(-)